MKYLFLFLIFVGNAGNAHAQNAKEIAKEFLQRYTGLADGSYRQANKEKPVSTGGYSRYEVPPIAGADRTEVVSAPTGLEYELTINRNNKNSVKLAKEMVKALEIIGKMPGYRCITSSADRTVLNKGSEEIMEFLHEAYVDIYPDAYAHIHIEAPTPYTAYLADEAVYRKGLPTVLTNSKDPQVIEINTPEKNSRMILNGLFENQKLTGGALRLYGYGDLFDGTWLSRQWSYDSTGVVPVCFVPAGTTDSITGYVSGFDLSTLTLYKPYYDGVNFSSTSPAWVLKTFAPYEKARKELGQKKYEAEYWQKNSVSSEEFDRQAERNRVEAEQREEAKCRYCGGTGTIPTGVYFMGKQYYKTCPQCHGTGSIN